MADDWQIEGADGEVIIGNAHLPDAEPVGVILVAHGFKGYKDYGMFPRIARTMAERGLIAHRFNFSHSGMTNAVETFERADLFARDTWNKAVFDCRAVIAAVDHGALEGRGLPLVMLGHSRGGVSVLLTAGRYADDMNLARLAGVVTAAAPSTCNPLSKDEAEELVKTGSLVSPSSRTGQQLRIGKAFLTEQLEDPPAHDLPALAAGIACPVLVIHGEQDPTVPVACAHQIAGACRQATVRVIAGADHVFNTPNPLAADAGASPQLAELLQAAGDFAVGCC
ncbi:MAG: alpha/beta hydrolase [Planctomycetota bacterium]|jgi:pimeloyl-ACP methyl ester carboxylesterase